MKARRMLTWQDRIDHYARTFPDRPPLHISRGSSGRVWIEGMWIGGNNYRGSGYYGAYPPDYLRRVWALFPDMRHRRTLHAFSGSLSKKEQGFRVDLHLQPCAGVYPDIQADVQYLPIRTGSIDFVLADTPYGPQHAARYGCRMPNRAKVMLELARVTRMGGFCVWLDTKLPMFQKKLWRWCGVILVVRSTNHDYRGAAIFKRTTLEFEMEDK